MSGVAAPAAAEAAEEDGEELEAVGEITMLTSGPFSAFFSDAEAEAEAEAAAPLDDL